MAMPVELFRRTDALLRGEAEAVESGRASSMAALALMIAGFGMWYGGVMGTFGGLAGDRPWQLLYSAVKVPILIMLTFAMSVPSFYVVNTLLGLRNDFPRVLRALLTTQAGLTVILASLSPLTAFWYASGPPYQVAILFNGAMFAVASLGAQAILRREYGPLIRKDGTHRWMLVVWVVLYIFVGIQMGWVLRPFVGSPIRPVQFFREDSWSNAYEFVLRLTWDVVMGRGS